MNKVWAVLIALLAVGATAEVTGMRERLFGRKRFRFVYATGSMREEESAAITHAGWKLEKEAPSPNITIQIAVSRSQATEAPWLAYFPGNDQTQLKTGVGVLEALRGAHEANLLALSYRGFSGSTGTPSVDEIRKDCLWIAQRFLKEHKVAAERLHVVGFSIGAHFSSYVAAELADGGTPPASLTLLSPAYDLVMVRPSPFERIAPGDDYQMAPFLASIRSRNLVLQGGADEAFGGPDQGKAAASILGPNGGSYLELAGIGHEAILENSEALSQAREFIWR